MYKKSFIILVSTLICFSATFAKNAGAGTVSGINSVKRDSFLYSYYEGLRLKLYSDSTDKALEKFERCLQIDSTDAGVYAEAGMIYASKKNTDKAIHYLEKSCFLSNNNWWYGMILVSLYNNSNYSNKAIALAEKLRGQYSQKEEIYHALVSLYSANKQYKKAIDAYNQLEKMNGIDESISFEKFQLYIQLNQEKNGIAEIDKLIKKFPNESRYKVLRGDIYMQQGQPEKALEIYNKIITDDPANPQVYVSLSEYYTAKNNSEKAISSVISALKNDELDVEEKISILNQYVNKLLSDTTKLDETESLFRLLTERYPFETRVHEYYAQFLGYRNRANEAYQEYETIVSIDPKNQNAWIQILIYLMRNQKYDEIILKSDKGIESLPDFAALYFYKAIAEYQRTNYAESLSLYTKASLCVKPDQLLFKSDIYGQLGDVNYKLGNKTNAFIAYDEALKANPKNIGILNNYAYYLSIEKADLSKAESMSAQTIALEPNNSIYLDTYAWIFYQRENYSLAKFYIERAISNLKPEQDATEMFEHYGDILLKTGNKEKALEMWKKSFDSGNKSDALIKKMDENSTETHNIKL